MKASKAGVVNHADKERIERAELLSEAVLDDAEGALFIVPDAIVRKGVNEKMHRSRTDSLMLDVNIMH